MFVHAGCHAHIAPCLNQTSLQLNSSIFEERVAGTSRLTCSADGGGHPPVHQRPVDCALICGRMHAPHEGLPQGILVLGVHGKACCMAEMNLNSAAADLCTLVQPGMPTPPKPSRRALTGSRLVSQHRLALRHPSKQCVLLAANRMCKHECAGGKHCAAVLSSICHVCCILMQIPAANCADGICKPVRRAHIQHGSSCVVCGRAPRTSQHQHQLEWACAAIQVCTLLGPAERMLDGHSLYVPYQHLHRVPSAAANALQKLCTKALPAS